jgi:ABC-type transporter Mla MlaB component
MNTLTTPENPTPTTPPAIDTSSVTDGLKATVSTARPGLAPVRHPGHAVRVDVRADVLPGPLTLVVEGCLTEDNSRPLLKTLGHALSLEGCPSVEVDLSAADHVDPDGLRALEAFVYWKKTTGAIPMVHIHTPPRPRDDSTAPDSDRPAITQAQAPTGAGATGPGAPVAPMTPVEATVAELMSPLGRTVCEADTLGHAADLIDAQGGMVALVNQTGHAIGTIIHTDLQAVAAQDPEHWRTRPCRDLPTRQDSSVRPEHLIRGVVWHYRQDQIRPLLVLNGPEAVGVLHPTAVFQWCAQHLPTALPVLSQRAADLAAAASPDAEPTTPTT